MGGIEKSGKVKTFKDMYVGINSNEMVRVHGFTKRRLVLI